MATRIVVPDAGQTTDEMLLMKWYVDVGDKVQTGDILADIETDKAIAELESHASGHVLALLADEGDAVTTGQTLLWLGEPGEAVPEEPPEAAPQPPDQIGIAPGEASASAPTEGSPGLATPAARTVAREHGVSLADIAGSGPDGCIVKRDVLTGLQAHDQSWEGTSEPLSPLRRALAARLQRSVREAPHFYVAMEVDMTQALIARKACEPAATVTDAIVKAVADTLTEFPRIHCKLDGDTVHYAPEVNVGIAVSVDDGVVVPTLPRPDMLTLAEVAARSRELIANVRAGRLPAGSASTFTVSNLGMFGVKSFTAIINPPEVAVLAVGAIEDKLVLRDGSVAAVPTLSLTLSCDHRVIDGALAARFLQALKRRLETPWAG